MKLNRKWLHEDFVDLSHVSDKEYVETLTVFGQKVETYERMDAEIKNVKVGRVASSPDSLVALPYLLAFAAGAMMYVVVEELIPESQAEPHSNLPTLGFTAGFVLMMILDCAV